MEIYNEDIIDLLSDRDNCVIEPREDQKRNLILAGLQEFIVTNVNHAMDLLYFLFYNLAAKDKKRENLPQTT
jgi:hypothetical protein